MADKPEDNVSEVTINPAFVDAVAKFVSEFFSRPLAEDLEEGIPASEFSVVEQSIEVLPFKCPALHEHRNIILKQVFKRNAEAVEAIPSLEEFVDRFKAEATAPAPADAIEVASETYSRPFAPDYDPDEETLTRVYALYEAFETKASLTQQPVLVMTPQGLVMMSMEELVKLTQGEADNAPVDFDDFADKPEGSNGPGGNSGPPVN